MNNRHLRSLALLSVVSLSACLASPDEDVDDHQWRSLDEADEADEVDFLWKGGGCSACPSCGYWSAHRREVGFLLGSQVIEDLWSQNHVSFKGRVTRDNWNKTATVTFPLSAMSHSDNGSRIWVHLSTGVMETSHDGVTSIESLEDASLEYLDALSLELVGGKAELWATFSEGGGSATKLGGQDIEIAIAPRESSGIGPCKGPG